MSDYDGWDDEFDTKLNGCGTAFVLLCIGSILLMLYLLCLGARLVGE